MADVPAYTPTTWNPDAAPGISAAQLQRIDDQVDALSTEFNGHNGGTGTSDHPEATTGVRGLMSAADKTKLDGIETAATQDQTPAQHLADIKTVDGAGSGLDADLLDGIDSLSFVRDTGDELIAGIKTFTSRVITTFGGSAASPGVTIGATGFGVYKESIYTGLTADGSAVIVGDGVDETYLSGLPVGGTVGVEMTGTQMFRVTSARRLKKNIVAAGPSYLGLLDLVAAHTFDWREDASPDRHHQYGHIADDIEEACETLGIDPDLFVSYDEDKPTNHFDDDEDAPPIETRLQSKRDRALLSLALDAIADLRARVAELEAA